MIPKYRISVNGAKRVFQVILRGNLKGETFLKGGIEIENIVEIIDCIGWLGFHPFILYEQINDFSEVPCGFNIPGIKDQKSEFAPFFDGELAEALAKDLPGYMAGLTGDFFNSKAEAVINKPHAAGIVSAVEFSDFLNCSFIRHKSAHFMAGSRAGVGCE